MSTSSITVERRGTVALLTFARPDQLNAMSGAMVEEIVAAIAVTERDDTARAQIGRAHV